MSNERCARQTKKGTRCQNPVARWFEPADPGADSCRTHLTPAELVVFLQRECEFEEKWGIRAWREREAELFASDPACWSWGSHPTADDIQRVKASFSPEVHMRLTDGDFAEFAMIEWHEKRCAICDNTGSLVLDHDHQTGLIRGKLCRSCNTCEGFRHGGVWDKYRRRNPATICGVESPYIDPFTLEEAKPAPPPDDPWKNHWMRNVDL